ncbi:Mfa1 family fimbria major subunit [uncultured Butyricimonas sp.]|uniref:Mfa1 family fimbria major subunit n=1 Tax=uncultured Butyricimonas sp. TaxID=1268785 RepID=UPI00259A2826|nr:Mfa1 family fimbria major subunit [uncultured Butyricimonas sp.]
MKKMYYFAATLLIMLFAACSNDHIGQDDDDGIVTDPTGEAWISLDIKTTAPKALGRALNNPDKEMGTPAESAVSKLRVIFFDENRNVTADKSFTVGTNSEAGEPGQPEGILGTAFKVPAASKRILVIANPSVDLPDVGLFNSYDDFNQAIVAVASLSTPSYFMMTNAKGDLEPSQANGDETDLTLYNSASKAESQPLSIHIDRAVAKVRVYTDNGNISSNNLKANISEPGWVLNATNKRYFPVSKRVKTWMEGTSRGCITPFDQYDLGSYRIDPNHDVQPLMSDPGFASYLQEYNYEMNAANIASSAWHPTEISVDNVEYCLENTQTADHNVWAYTTQVLFKVIYSPKGLIDPDKNVYNNPADNVNNGELLPGTDWLMVNGGYYTWNLLMDYIKAELLYKYTSEDKDPTVIYTAALSKTLNSYLKAIGTPEVSTDRGNGTSETRANEVVDNFNQKRSNVENYGAFRHGTVSYYKGGVNYYPIMIKHDDTDQVYNEYGEFGVVRNSVYDVHISKVNNPGYPNIPEPDPGTKDEDEDNYLSIRINVNPWTCYTQTEEL